MAVVREGMLDTKPAHHEKRNMIDHACPFGIPTGARIPRGAPIFLSGMDQETATLQLSA